MDSRKPNNNLPLNNFLLWEKTDKKTGSPTWFKREKSEQPIGKAASDAAVNAKTAAKLAMPLVTAAGIEIMSQPNNGFINLAPLGFPVAVGGVIIDTAKAPLCIAVATEEAVRAGITKLASLIFEKPPTELEIERIFKSFLIRLKETATILIALGLEDADVLNQRLKSGDLEELVGLTLLHTAYASRNYYSGLVLASDKVLLRGDCPTQGLPLFDKIMEVKASIQKAFSLADASNSLDKQARQLEESRLVCKWIRDIKAGKQLSAADRPDASEQQLAVVNKIMTQIHDLKNYGMPMLPETPQQIASHLPKFKR